MLLTAWEHTERNRCRDFEAMKAGKLAIQPRLSCQYSENMPMDLPSSVVFPNIHLGVKKFYCYLKYSFVQLCMPFKFFVNMDESIYNHETFDKTTYKLSRGWFPKFATGLNIIIGCRSKSIWVTRLLFCQNDSPIWGSFWQKDSLITHILFELCLLWYLAQSQIWCITLYIIRFCPKQIQILF